MVDDEGPQSSTPWGRPGDSGRRGGTPVPPSPGPTGPGVPPATTPGVPAWPGASPVPPVPGGRSGGLSGGALAALIAVVVVALLAVGGGVFLITSGGDDDATAGDGTRPASTSTPTSAGSSPVGSGSTAPSSSEVPSSEGEGEPPGTLVPPSSIPGFPSGTEDLAPPAEFPRPDGASPDAFTGGLSVPGSATDAADFYEGALPAAGFTVARNELPGVAAVLTVSGGGVDGQLVFVDLGLGATTVLWTPS